MKSTTFKTRQDMIDYFEIQKDPDEVDVITDHLPEPEKCCTICEFSEPGDGCGANEPTETLMGPDRLPLNFPFGDN